MLIIILFSSSSFHIVDSSIETPVRVMYDTLRFQLFLGIA